MSDSTYAKLAVPPDMLQAAIGRFVVHLGGTGSAGLRDGLQALVRDTALSSAVVRRHDGVLAALAGDAHLSVSRGRELLAPVDILAVPVPGPGGTVDAQLLVTGAGAWHAEALTVAAAAIGLALAGERHLESDLLLSAEQDRDELADALHDGPVQQLVFARYAADAAVRGDDPVVARDAVQGALVELRRFMWHLRPRAADLPHALEELSLHLAEAGQRVLGVSVQAGDSSPTRAGAALAYRLVQAVAMVGSSAQPPLGVTLRRHDDGVVVTVDGSIPRIDRWQRRARALGGSLSVDRDGLRLALPLRDPSPLDLEPKASS
jgi:signal transduction histidine kinase